MRDRGLHTIVVVAAFVLIGATIATGQSVPGELWAVVTTVVGGYFGAAIPADPRTPIDATIPGPRHATPDS